MKIGQKATNFFCIDFHLFTEWLPNFISLNILLFVHLEFFEEFVNIPVFYPVNVESDMWAHYHLDCC